MDTFSLNYFLHLYLFLYLDNICMRYIIQQNEITNKFCLFLLVLTVLSHDSI
jgi:hypothetical protein